MDVVDEINCQILAILQQNGRTSYTDIAKQVGLSVDSVKKRVDKMIAKELFHPKIQLRPRNFGYNSVVDVRVKLKDFTKQDLDSFIDYLNKFPNVVELFLLSGTWNLALVLIAKNAQHLGELTTQIRTKYGNIIQEWSESLTTKAIKFESYDMKNLV